MKPVMLSASILSADFARLGDDVKAMLAAGADYIHFDVMDHHFVPNLSFGAVVCQALRQAGITAPIDVHLMVEQPQHYTQAFADAGANVLTFHPETVDDVAVNIRAIHDAGMQAGLALNPDKPLTMVKDYLAQIDMLLIMSVYPGFSGQSFIADSLKKITEARQLIAQHESDAWLAIDGGVKVSNIAEIVAAGADFCVLGSGLFSADDYSRRVIDIRASLNN